jgi:serine/threonine-protein kinase
MSELSRNLFIALLVETVVILLAIILKEDKRKMAVALIIGTIIAGMLGFLPSPIESALASVFMSSTTTHTLETTEQAFPATSIDTPASSLPPTIESSSNLVLLPELTLKNAEMVLIPAGTFTMGSDNGHADEKPPHKVSLSAFYMDKYEVTNALYKMCAEAAGCQSPRNPTSFTRTSYYGNSQFDNYPVLYVDWNMAKTYCEWRGARLPSEAEWEYAARGTDGRTYPWGEGLDKTRANYRGKDTTAVGSYESGKSPFGIYDMAGNVWEWVADWYDVYPGGDPNASSSFGQNNRIIRGGTWYYALDLDFIRSADRMDKEPDSSDNVVGFRCALTP